MDCGQAGRTGRINAVTGSAEFEKVVDAGQTSAHSKVFQSHIELTGQE